MSNIIYSMTSKILVYGGILVAIIAVLISMAPRMLPPSLDLRPAGSHATETMSAIIYRQHGNARVMEYATVPKPVPKSTQYLIRAEASALNPVDFKMRRNANMPQFLIPLPKIMGADMAGVVVEVPSTGSGKFQVGDRVAALLPILSKWGAHAEYAAVEEALLARIGDETSILDAAAYPLVGLTVLQNFANLHTPPQAGDQLLVHAGAGGVGTFAIQYASKVLGMKVATTASAAKSNLLKALGADLVVDYHTQQFEDIVKDYDVVLDPMSWLYEERTLMSGVLKPTGHYLNVPSSDSKFEGFEKGNGLPSFFNVVLSKWKNLLSPGSTPKYGLVAVAPNGKDVQQVMDLMEIGKIRAVIDRTYHLSEAMEAYQYLEGHATGKVVLYHGVKKQPEQKPKEVAVEEPEEKVPENKAVDVEASEEESHRGGR